MKVIFTRTNSAHTRIRATDGDGNTASAIRDSSRQFEEQHEDAVRALCNKMGWKGSLIGGYVLKDGETIGRAWIFDDARALRIDLTPPSTAPCCPNCGKPVDRPNAGCLLHDLVQVARERGRTEEAELLQTHANADADELWHRFIGPAVDAIEDGDAEFNDD